MNSAERGAIALADSSVATEAAERLLFDAIQNGAHTLHLEPHQEAARIRYRIDGLLHEWAQLSHHAHNALIAHFKHRANLVADEKRWSQEGRFTFTADGAQYSIKLTTLPLANGEKAVLKVFNKSKQAHTLAELGIWGDTRKRLNKMLAARQGLVVVSGAQHSGISTTLRCLLTTLNRPSRSIVSIEDPIEHGMPGVHQLRIDRAKGIDVVKGLEVATRSDANIVVVNNLHGKQATDAVLETTMKGRMVLAGMHSRSITQSLHQLSAATSEHYMLAHNLLAVVHQQLVHRLCDSCKIPAKPDAATLRKLTTRTNITVATLQRFMQETARHRGEATMRLYAAHPSGCKNCNYTGFRGQIGIFEVLATSPQVQRRLSAHGEPLTVLHHAVKGGMMPMVVDGFVKALCGLTTIEEVLHSYRGA